LFQKITKQLEELAISPNKVRREAGGLVARPPLFKENVYRAIHAVLQALP
jgi:hypothetical protein